MLFQFELVLICVEFKIMGYHLTVKYEKDCSKKFFKVKSITNYFGTNIYIK